MDMVISGGREGPAAQGDWKRGTSLESLVFKEWEVNHIECCCVVQQDEYREGSLDFDEQTVGEE